MGDTIASVSYMTPQSLDHLDELVRGPDGSLCDIELHQRGLDKTCTLHLLRSGPASQVHDLAAM